MVNKIEIEYAFRLPEDNASIAIIDFGGVLEGLSIQLSTFEMDPTNPRAQVEYDVLTHAPTLSPTATKELCEVLLESIVNDILREAIKSFTSK